MIHSETVNGVIHDWETLDAPLLDGKGATRAPAGWISWESWRPAVVVAATPVPDFKALSDALAASPSLDQATKTAIVAAMKGTA